LRDLAVSDLKCSGLETDPVLTSSDMANLHSAVESGLALALLPESSVTSSRVRPVQLNELPGQRLLSMNVVTANTLGPSFLEPLQDCILAAKRALIRQN